MYLILRDRQRNYPILQSVVNNVNICKTTIFILAVIMIHFSLNLFKVLKNFTYWICRLGGTKAEYT